MAAAVPLAAALGGLLVAVVAAPASGQQETSSLVGNETTVAPGLTRPVQILVDLGCSAHLRADPG